VEADEKQKVLERDSHASSRVAVGMTCYHAFMTKLLDQAIAKVRELPDDNQDRVGAIMLSMIDQDTSAVPLDDEARATIREGLEQARHGEFVPDKEIEALWKRHGL
jgi:predicted transcriptional regulator